MTLQDPGPCATGEAAGGSFHTFVEGADVVGFVAIDSTVGGRARGGLRLLPDVGEGELRAAARAMTLKYGFLGLPQGGAKAGVRGDGEGSPETRRERLLAFARAAEPLLRDRRYVPDPDLGTSAEDIRWLLRAAGVSARRRDHRTRSSGLYTAVSALASAEAALRARGEALAGRRVAIQGFGSVGSALGNLVRARGGRVVAVSTSRGALHDPDGLDVPGLVRAAASVGSRLVEERPAAGRLPREALLELPVDVLFPCARHHAIHAGNAERVAARLICSGANDPVSPEAERALFRRGLLVLPDFVTNCGGVLGGTLEFAGVAPSRACALVEEHLRRAIPPLLASAEEGHVPVRAVAEPLALRRHERVRSATERPGVGTRALHLGLEAYRRGWLPKALLGSLAPAYLSRRLRG